MNLTLKNALINAAYYALTLVALPWLFLELEDALGLSRQPHPVLRAFSGALLLGGAALQLWCIVLFQRFGHGTPSPPAAPTKLVTRGPYVRVRNPMNLGELMVFVGLAGWFASPALLVYAALAGLAFHAFVTRYEEPRLRRRFEGSYAAYEARTSRWLPSVRPERT